MNLGHWLEVDIHVFVNDTVVAAVILEVDIHVFVVILLLRNASLIPASLLMHYYSQVLVEISFWVFLFKIARSANWVFFLNI